jgi:hypothetical protein
MAVPVAVHQPVRDGREDNWLDPTTDLSCANSTRNHWRTLSTNRRIWRLTSPSSASRAPVSISRRPVPGRVGRSSRDRVSESSRHPRLLPPETRPAPTWKCLGAGCGPNAGMVSHPPAGLSWSRRRPPGTTVAADGRAHARCAAKGGHGAVAPFGVMIPAHWGVPDAQGTVDYASGHAGERGWRRSEVSTGRRPARRAVRKGSTHQAGRRIRRRR